MKAATGPRSAKKEAVMSDRASTLAERFALANAEFAAFMQDVSEAQWRRVIGEGELRSIGVVGRHVAWGYGFEQRYFGAIADGHPLPPVVLAEFVTRAADRARDWEDVTKAEVLEALTTAGAAAAAWLRGLSDEQLDRRGAYPEGLPARSVQEWVERLLLTHAGSHLTEIRTALQS
jgi:hypothetical protein